ncbi:MAG: CBS domain-containing protein [Micromonosporaceae bacterium]
MTRLKISDVMTRGAVAVRENASYQEIALTLTEHRISAVPVLDVADHVVGVVSEADLLHTLELQGDEPTGGCSWAAGAGWPATRHTRTTPRD